MIPVHDYAYFKTSFLILTYVCSAAGVGDSMSDRQRYNKLYPNIQYPLYLERPLRWRLAINCIL